MPPLDDASFPTVPASAPSEAFDVPLCVACGVGTDSVAMLVGLWKRGIRPDHITFTNTGSERAHTYRYIPILQAWLRSVGFPEMVVAIGYDAGPADCRRSKIKESPRYTYRYFLREWGWDRPRCEAEILSVGLPLPGKSACFMCKAQKPHELADMVENEPHLADRIIAMEANAAPNLRNVEGLWRSTVKGCRGATARPGSMTTFILAHRAERARRSLPVLND